MSKFKTKYTQPCNIHSFSIKNKNKSYFPWLRVVSISSLSGEEKTEKRNKEIQGDNNTNTK